VLSDVAELRITDGPPMLRSENARLAGFVYVDIRGRDLKSAVQDMQKAVAEQVKLPPGYSVSWSGQFEFLERATAKLKVVVPFTLLIIFVLLYLTFRRFDEALLIMATLPFALVGGIWLLYLLGYNLSVAGAVGFIALAGVAAEFGVIMLLYLKQAWDERVARRARQRRRPAGRDPRRCGAARAAQGDDGRRDPGRPVPDHVGHRHRLGSDAAHRRADGGRHDHGAAAVDVRDSGSGTRFGRQRLGRVIHDHGGSGAAQTECQRQAQIAGASIEIAAVCGQDTEVTPLQGGAEIRPDA
jgi:hypothetical protein